jgi:hypothetical protein
MKKNSQSIFDSLMRIMPELNENVRFGGDSVDPLAANSLFQVWRTGSSSNQKVYNRPHTLSHDDLRRMQKADLVKVIGDKFEVTEKGANVIKVMILGDDRSIFEEGMTMDYHTALDNTKNVKTAKKQKQASTFWDILEEEKE